MDFFCKDRAIEELKGGSIKAFTLLYNFYAERVYAFAMRLCANNRHRSEEVVQEVFVKVWENHTKIDLTKSFGSWLFTITKNIVINNHRHQLIKFIHSEFILKFGCEEHHDLEEWIDEQYLKEKLDKIVHNMPTQRKKVFELSRNQFLSNKEIAARLQISESTVESHINKALNSIRESLAGSMDKTPIMILFLLTVEELSRSIVNLI